MNKDWKEEFNKTFPLGCDTWVLERHKKEIEDYIQNTIIPMAEEEAKIELLSWINKESIKSARYGVLGYDFVSRLEKKLEREIFELGEQNRG